MMKISEFYIYVCIVFLCWKLQVNSGQNNRPRGVSLSNGPFYSDSEKFTCLDGSLTIPKSKVNDDYCDCKDGTDEPGTAACPSGMFHCNNRGYKPMYIPSSRVNDGICDCCDTSDEYDSPTRSLCVNTCKELGKAHLAAKNQEALIQNEGFEIRKGYIKQGQETKTERQQSLGKLKEEIEQIEQVKDEKEALKEEAERPEKEAKEKHKAAWEAEKARRQEEQDRQDAAVAFVELDQNQDGKVNFEEIQLHSELDPDEKNEFTPEEAMGVLGSKPEVLQNEFVEEVWKNIKEKYESHKEEPTDIPPVEVPGDVPIAEPPAPEEEDLEDEDAAFDDDYDDYDDEEDFDENYDDDEDDDGDEAVRRYKEMKEKREQKKKQEAADEDMPEYDEYTKNLIKIADEARDAYNEVDSRMKEIEKSISSLEKQLDVDLGEDQEFQPLQGECFEYTDREYTYKLCVFDKASQRPKSGGSETSLGKWGQWSGPGDNKYSEMKYTGGLKCWNGPDRSCVVKLTCGKENQLTAATEPERCVYEFKMTTPALCNKKIDLNSGNIDVHEEL